ncbi:MAG TPA: hypothetical protein VHX44_07375 [Planctomycetota bacterium]|jgi:hypothetical protein|nr:hypothetical protein [Planctomycetota bacterium]
MFSPTEIVTLVIQLAALPFVIIMLRSSDIPGRGLFALAYACLLTSNIATVVEGALWPVFFDSVEHLSMALFALVFISAVWVFLRDHPQDDV